MRSRHSARCTIDLWSYDGTLDRIHPERLGLERKQAKMHHSS
jgi:hypothetical protein